MPRRNVLKGLKTEDIFSGIEKDALMITIYNHY